MKYKCNELLKKHTSFKIGGPAQYFVEVTDVEELKEALSFAKEKKLKIYIIGAGSNLLVSDQGFMGLVIKISFNWLKIGGTLVKVGAGMLLSEFLNELAKQGLAGLEFLAGVPGTIGGAAVMNAGAWDNNIGQYIKSIVVIDQDGEEKILKPDQLGFKYRCSALQPACRRVGADKQVVVEVVFKLTQAKKAKIKKKINKNLALRRSKQPLDWPSCGSVFKNPQGGHAGYLIEQAGLRGLRVGDAEVSKKHGNFIVNLGQARAADVLKLIKMVQKQVETKLEPEVVLLK